MIPLSLMRISLWQFMLSDRVGSVTKHSSCWYYHSNMVTTFGWNHHFIDWELHIRCDILFRPYYYHFTTFSSIFHGFFGMVTQHNRSAVPTPWHGASWQVANIGFYDDISILFSLVSNPKQIFQGFSWKFLKLGSLPSSIQNEDPIIKIHLLISLYDIWDACYIIFCHLLHIHSGKTGILFSLLLCSLWWVQIVGYVLACRSCSFVCTLLHLIIIIVQTYLKTLNLINACQIYFVECVSEIKHIFSVIHCTLYGAVCFQFTHFPYDDWVSIQFVLLSSSNRKYELLSIV